MSEKADRQECTKCKGDGYLVEARGATATARRCDCRKECGECGGRGFVLREEGRTAVAVPCGCAGLDRRIALFNAALVPARFANCWIEEYVESNPSQKEAKYALLEAREVCRTGAPGFLLWGEPGLGKTHLLCGLIGYLALERGISCRYVDFMQLLFDLKQAYAQGLWESDVVAPLLSVDVLVIDELGKGRNSEWELSVLDELISSRYNARKTIHCTSNYMPEGRRAAEGRIEEALAPAASLQERLGERIFSRLSEMCRFFHVTGEDWRRKAHRRIGKKGTKG